MTKLSGHGSFVTGAADLPGARSPRVVAGEPAVAATFPNAYCPHTPTATQAAFLALKEVEEVFFGGAAGGGKSDALLMAALEYVHVPGYAALIVRKDTQRLALAGGLIPRSHAWLADSPATYNADRRQWSFPTSGPPATLTFGFLAHSSDKYRYQSSEFQYIAFDELTELAEEDYLFLFSRLRRVKQMPVPLRIRAASNPGNVGHLWVKARFVDGGRVFIPSRIADNPYLDEAEYRATLGHLPPVARERLMNGDWSVAEEGQIKAEWLRYYVESGKQLELFDPQGRTLAIVQPHECRRFITVDPAGTSADKAREARGHAPSWTVAQVWEQPRRHELARFLLLRHQERVLVAFTGLCGLIQRLCRDWDAERVWIENEKFGAAATDALRQSLRIETIATGTKDKATRAAPLMLKLEAGEVFLPKFENSWRHLFEAELLAWTGTSDEPADQIDAAAYAAIVANQHRGRVLKVLPVHRS